MKRAIIALISLLFVISSAYSAVNYVYFDAKFQRQNTSDLGDKKVYYDDNRVVYYKDRSIKTFDRKYQTTYRDLKRNYDISVFRTRAYQTQNLGDRSEVFEDRNRRKESIQTERSQYLEDQREANPTRWRNFMTSSDYLNNYFK